MGLPACWLYAAVALKFEASRTLLFSSSMIKQLLQYTNINTITYTYIPTYIHAFLIHIHTHIRTYVRTYIHMYVRTYIHTYKHVCMYIHTHMCICIYILKSEVDGLLPCYQPWPETPSQKKRASGNPLKAPSLPLAFALLLALLALGLGIVEGLLELPLVG